jgi:ABC-type branched-subunit amino acid transport system substrate-binding protein
MAQQHNSAANRAGPAAPAPDGSKSGNGLNRYLGVVALAAVLFVAGLFFWRSPIGSLWGKAPAGGSAAGAGNTDIGVTANEIHLGMSAAFTGPAKELGLSMRSGIDACFADVNAKGGVHGRKIRFTTEDDGYEPARCRTAMAKLREQDRVFAVIGNVGTPTAEVGVPYAMSQQMIFFGAYTGAGLLRKNPPDRYVFNYRASYGEETAALVSYLVKRRKIDVSQIAVFSQNDGYGEAGYQGVARAVTQFGGDPARIVRVKYERNTVAVEDAAAKILSKRDQVKAVIMVPAYKPAAKFIKLLKDQKMDATFCSVSFVNSEALVDELKANSPQYMEGVIVSQVVPHYRYVHPDTNDFNRCMQTYVPNRGPNFGALEGFLAARLFVAALEKVGPNLTTERLVETLESIDALDLGVGSSVSFSRTDHQGSHKVWGVELDASGLFQPLKLD